MLPNSKRVLSFYINSTRKKVPVHHRPILMTVWDWLSTTRKELLNSTKRKRNLYWQKNSLISTFRVSLNLFPLTRKTRTSSLSMTCIDKSKTLSKTTLQLCGLSLMLTNFKKCSTSSLTPSKENWVKSTAETLSTISFTRKYSPSKTRFLWSFSSKMGPSPTDTGKSWWDKLEILSRFPSKPWLLIKSSPWISRNTKKSCLKSSTKPFRNLKMKRNWIKLSKFGKNRILTSSSTKKEPKIEDGSLLILRKRNFYLKINWPISRLLPPTSMLERSQAKSGTGKELSTWFRSVLKSGCKYKKNGCIWKEFLLEMKISSNSSRNKAKSSKKTTRLSKKSWNTAQKHPTSWPLV